MLRAQQARISLGHTWQLLTRHLRPLKGLVAALGALLAGSIALQLVQPQVLRQFVDSATTGAPAQRLTWTAALYVVLALAQQLFAVGATYFSERMGWAATNALREELMLHCLRLDLSFHKARTPGELIERIDGDVTALANFFSQFIVQIVGNALLLLGVIVLLWRVDWRAGFSLVVFAVVAFLTMNRMRGITVPYWKRARQASAELYGFLEERLGGTEDIRASGATAYVIRRFYAPLRERVLANCKARVIGALQWTTPDLLFNIEIAASFIITLVLYREGSITIGTALMINFYTQLSFRPLRVITNQMEDFQKAGAGIVRVQELLQERSVLRDPDAPASIPLGPLAVEFDHVSFGYGDEEMVLRDLSFRLEPGKILGLLGRTGSGKTTISRLLFRLYDPAEGAIRLSGVDLRDARRGDLRQRVGMVTQDVQLFRATVRDNVTFFDTHIEDAAILRALEGLGLAEWYHALPEGLDTVLGSGGSGVSAGEAQLLAFTRVFLNDPGAVVLDEASSRLDPATERLIERAVKRLLTGRTGIIIAHRLATIQRADEVMLLEHGRIVEHGAREALASDPHSGLAALLRTGLETAFDGAAAQDGREYEPVVAANG